MRRILVFIFLAISSLTSYSQNLSYTCPRDTVLGCGINCVDLKITIPDLLGVGDNYVVGSVSQQVKCYPLASPGGPGPSSNIVADDKYSPVIPLPFPFRFYGITYNSLLIGANGNVTFDISLAGADAHYDDLGDLPNTLYDPAMIMGPYHDLDIRTASPGKQIKYETYGNAPNRKFIVTFYRIALFDCDALNRNTSQIILHESTGVIETTIIDQQICTGWINGKAMVGLQDMTRTKGITAPNRKMSDPAWGSVGMNETWRFTPIGGPHLYKSMQLLDGSGAVVATGDTTRIDATNLGWTFTNVCPPNNGPSIYVVKTTYQKIDDPAQTYFSLDTIRVTRNAFPVSATATNTTCGASVGTITASQTGGTAPYTYSLDAGAGQASNVFPNIGAGTYTVTVVDATGCRNTATVTVGTTSSLNGTATQQNVSCPGNSDGTITVTPTSGTAPYSYSANGGPSQASNVFTNLPPGLYNIVFTDAAGCRGTVTRTLTQGSGISGSSSSTGTSCAGNNNGTITATGSNGVAPYTYSLDGGPFQPTGIFTGVSAGAHVITIRDSRGCSVSINRNVALGTGLTSTVVITSAACATASNGTFTVTPTNGTAPYTYSIDGGSPQASNVFAGLPPGSHTVTFRDATNCVGTITRTVGAGSGLTGTAVQTSTSCPNINDGTVTITPTNGTAPYTFSLDGGAAQATGVFTGVSATAHSVVIRDANNCTGTVPVTVTSGPALTATATTVATSCPTRNDGSITVTPTGTGPYTYTLNPGNVVQTSNVFTNLGPGTYTISFTAGSGCGGNVTINPIIAAGPFLSSTVTTVHQPVCANINDGSITIVPGGTGPYSFTLTPGGTQTTPTFSNLAPGNYNYTFTSANGCTGSGSFTLNSNPALKSPSVKVMPSCNGNNNGSITFNISGGVAPYQYALAPYTTYQTSNVFNGLIAGTYNFRIKDNVGCTKDTTIVLAEPTVLTASATNTKVATCNGNDGTITVTGGGGTLPYQYSINNGANYQSSNIFIAPDTGFYANVKVKDAKGCITNTTVTVALLDTMRLELGPNQTICAGSSVTLQPQTNTATTVFTWTAQNVPLSSLSDPKVKNPVATPQDTAIYTLIAQWGICKRQDAVTINVLHKPIVSAGLDTAICNQATQTIPSVATLMGSATNLSGTVNYAWEPANKVSFPTQAVTPAKTDSTQQFILTVTDNYGCNFVVKDTVIVFVQPPVQAFAGRDTIAMYGRPHQLMASGGTGYLWSPAGPLNDPHLANPLATLTADTRFTVVVTDVAGCEGYDTVFVKAYEGPMYYVPNAFSPNGDGRNDIFRAIPSGIASTEYFRVFDRFGVLLFETNQWLKGWDGTYRGKKQPIGTYVWMVKGKDQNGHVVEQKGTVIIVQ